MPATSGTAVLTLPSDTEILMVREFDAPRELVFKAYTTPELVRRWWAGKRGNVTVAEIDLRVGGRWRYVMEANEGFEVAFHGEFREIVPNERLEKLPPSGLRHRVERVRRRRCPGHAGIICLYGNMSRD